MNLDTLPGIWRQEAERTRRFDSGSPVAQTLLVCADEVESALRLQQEEILTLAEAARLAGYSEDHLGRLVRQGSIPNAGQKGSPRIRRGDLPRKPPPMSEAVAQTVESHHLLDGLFRDILTSKCGVR